MSTHTTDLPLNGTFFGASTVRARNAMFPSYEPCAALVGCAVEVFSSPMFAPPAGRFGVVARVVRGFFGEPVAIVRDQTGAEHEVASIYPDTGRGPIGWHLCRRERVPADVLAALAA